MFSLFFLFFHYEYLQMNFSICLPTELDVLTHPFYFRVPFFSLFYRIFINVWYILIASSIIYSNYWFLQFIAIINSSNLFLSFIRIIYSVLLLVISYLFRDESTSSSAWTEITLVEVRAHSLRQKRYSWCKSVFGTICQLQFSTESDPLPSVLWICF